MGVRNLQPADECKCRGILTAVGNFGQLALKVANVKLETVALSNFDSEKVVTVLLDLSAEAY